MSFQDLIPEILDQFSSLAEEAGHPEWVTVYSNVLDFYTVVPDSVMTATTTIDYEDVSTEAWFTSFTAVYTNSDYRSLRQIYTDLATFYGFTPQALPTPEWATANGDSAVAEATSSVSNSTGDHESESSADAANIVVPSVALALVLAIL